MIHKIGTIITIINWKCFFKKSRFTIVIFITRDHVITCVVIIIREENQLNIYISITNYILEDQFISSQAIYQIISPRCDHYSKVPKKSSVLVKIIQSLRF